MASPYDFMGDLKFDFKEVPTWRGDSGEKTTAMLSDIVKYYEKYENLPQPAKDFCKNSFAKLMTMKFVLDVNIGKSVGTQTADGTRAVYRCLHRRKTAVTYESWWRPGSEQ